MKKPILIILVIAVLAGALFFSLGFHVIVTSQKTLVVGKETLSFKDSFVDVREWASVDYLRHPRVTNILVKEGLYTAVSTLPGSGMKVKDAAKAIRKTGTRIKEAVQSDSVQKTVQKSKAVFGKTKGLVKGKLKGLRDKLGNH